MNLVKIIVANKSGAELEQCGLECCVSGVEW